MTILLRFTTSRYAFFGALFGLCFPLIGTSIDAWATYGHISGATLSAVQGANPLLWIINTAPLFLGFFAGIAGVRQERVESLAAHQEQIILEQTHDLRQALADAEEANQARTAFLANISNDVSVPVEKLNTLIDELAENIDAEPHISLIEEARNNGHTLLISLSNLVDYTKISAGLLKLDEQPMQLNHTITESIELVAHTRENVRIEYTPSPVADEVVYGDEVRIGQILTNLLNLSLKYTRRGLIRVSVQSVQPEDSTTGHPNERHFEFVVDDNGIGLPTEQLERLLRPLDHISHSTHKYGSTGLGLVISKTLSEMMGGRIWGEYKGKRLGNRYMFNIIVKNAQSQEPNSVGKQHAEHRQAQVSTSVFASIPASNPPAATKAIDGL